MKLEDMKPGKWYRDGVGKVYFYCGTDKTGKFILQSKASDELLRIFDVSILVEVHEAESWPLETPVMCRQSEHRDEELRFFAGIRDGQLMAFKLDCSAKSLTPQFAPWNFMRLATPEEIKEHTSPFPDWCAKPGIVK